MHDDAASFAESAAMKVELYGTAFCHLCDEALALLQATPVTVEYIDIAEHDVAMERYGIRIPVVRIPDNGAELGWPFDAHVLVEFLAE